MTVLTIGSLAAGIFGISIVSSMLGQGGGVLYTPLQVLFGIDFHIATTTSLFLIMVTSLSATIVFRKARLVDWPLAFALESATALGGFAGGYFSREFSGSFLTGLFSGVVAFSAFFMISDFRFHREGSTRENGFLSWKRQLGDKTYCVNLGLALPLSFMAGVISGLVGVGGGIIKVPMMVLLLGIPMEIAIASSAFMVGLTALAGFSGHLFSGYWDWKTSLILAVAVFVGAQIGARVSIGIDKNKIKKGFGWFLLVVAILMLIRR